ncbi:hypothetical protein A2U01_0017681 [Trifolium medium]|uniref:Uncharacterized protein n=1 Tax=Trifolium medium TaxID=97028 RepID=A0A392NAI8_9FABA|nr:hypothetical protein [Trifolium medium]
MKGNFVVSTGNTDRAGVVVVIFSNNTIEADNFVVSTGVNSILQEFKEVFKDQIQLHPMYEKELKTTHFRAQWGSILVSLSVKYVLKLLDHRSD